MTSKSYIDDKLKCEDETPQASLDSAEVIMYAGGYECSGLKIIFNHNASPQWQVFARFSHIDYTDVIEHMFTGFDLNRNRGAKAMQAFLEMFNVHPHFNPFQPKRGYDWGYYAKDKGEDLRGRRRNY